MAEQKSTSVALHVRPGGRVQADTISELRARLNRGGVNSSLTESRASGSIKATTQSNGTPMEVLEQLKVLA